MAARKALLATAGATTYCGATYIGYLYFRADEAPSACGCGGSDGAPSLSLSDPRRAERFDSIAPCYDSRINFDENIMGIPLLRRWLLRSHASGSVLEVGAGTGRNVKHYPRGGVVSKVTLTDASASMVLEARRAVTDAPSDCPPMRVDVANASSLDGTFDPNSFDTVVDTFGLCSYDDPVAVLKQMAKLCRPGGKLLLLEHGRSKTWNVVSRALDKSAGRHAEEWGCVWNRDIDAILEGVKGELEVEVLWTWHFGTTYYVVCTPKKSVGVGGG